MDQIINSATKDLASLLLPLNVSTHEINKEEAKKENRDLKTEYDNKPEQSGTHFLNL